MWLLKAAVRAYKHLQSASSNLWPCLFAHSCQQAAASVLAGCSSSWKPNRKRRHILCSVMLRDNAGLSRRNDRMKGRKKTETESGAADEWKEEAVCVSFSFSACGSDVPDSVVLFKASQTNKKL